MKPRIAVLGCGYWGSNHIRTLKALGAHHAVSDANRARAVGVGDGMVRAERLERADVVRAPVSASKDSYARFHHLPAQEIVSDT